MPTYAYTCVLCGDFELWRSIHAEPLEACPECGNVVAKVISIPMLHGVGSRGARTRDVDATERRWGKDMGAYQRLRMEGHQPRGIDGCDKLEATALGSWEIKTGQRHSDQAIQRVEGIVAEITTKA